MTASPRTVRGAAPLHGPLVATVGDIPQLNAVFAETFTDRYRKDGMTGVRVPPLNPSVWRYAIEDAGQVRARERGVRNIDDLHLALRIDEIHPWLGKRTIGFLGGAGLGDVETERPHLRDRKVVCDGEPPA